MFKKTVFTKSFLRTKENNKLRLLTIFAWNIIRRGTGLFLICALVAFLTAKTYFNLGVNFKNQLLSSKDVETSIFERQNLEFKFIFFSEKLRFRVENLSIKEYLALFLTVSFLVKSFLALVHFFVMNYCYSLMALKLKKDLFRQFVRANFAQGALVSSQLITQFANDLDMIAEHI